MATVPMFSANQLRAICDILGATDGGLSGGQIGQLLSTCKISDPNPSHTKSYRLFHALNVRQEQDACGNQVVNFIQTCMDPVRYVGNEASFEEWRSKLNNVLVFSGYSIGKDGKFRTVTSASTLSEAQERANRLRLVLASRSIHPDVLRFCQAELLQDNYFHAVFEATKSVADKIREKSGLDGDGAMLVDRAFGKGKQEYPLWVFNTYQSETDRNEHTGLMNLMKGMFGLFRNTTAHAPKIRWAITEQDAIDMLTLASMLHRRLDLVVRSR